jgi:hypothetical protein
VLEDGYVYVARNEIGDLKLGCCSDVGRRIYELDAELVWSTDQYRLTEMVERRAHGILLSTNTRVSGEWYTCPLSVVITSIECAHNQLIGRQLPLFLRKSTRSAGSAVARPSYVSMKSAAWRKMAESEFSQRGFPSKSPSYWARGMASKG